VYLKIKKLLKNALQLFRLFTIAKVYLVLYNNHLSKNSITESEAELMKVQQTNETRSRYLESLDEVFPSPFT